MKSTAKLPASFKRPLWPYDLSKVRPQQDGREVITRVLNYGTWEDVKELRFLYSEKDLRRAITHPLRGSWFEKALNFWVTMFNIKLSKPAFEKALIRLDPQNTRKS